MAVYTASGSSPVEVACGVRDDSAQGRRPVGRVEDGQLCHSAAAGNHLEHHAAGAVVTWAASPRSPVDIAGGVQKDSAVGVRPGSKVEGGQRGDGAAAPGNLEHSSGV